jgi:hypothetical protein
MNDKIPTVWSVMQASPKEAAALVSLAMLAAAISFALLRMIAAVAR